MTLMEYHGLKFVEMLRLVLTRKLKFLMTTQMDLSALAIEVDRMLKTMVQKTITLMIKILEEGR